MHKDATAPSQIPVSIPDSNGHPYLIAPDPADEPQRLAALRALELLDTPAEDRFDRITRLAVKLFQVPIAYLALVDARRQWFKSRVRNERLRNVARGIVL